MSEGNCLPLTRERRRLGRFQTSVVAAVICLGLIPLCAAQAGPPRGCNSPSDAFSLVSQALRAKAHVIYIARQDILWTSPASQEDMPQIVVDIDRSGHRCRMVYQFPPDTAGRVMLDDGAHSFLYDPSRLVLFIGQSVSEDQNAASPEMLTLLHHNYGCLRLRREPMNGESCDVVAIRPHSGSGPSKILWIDVRRHAILRTEEYDAQGSRCYVSSFEAIQFPGRLPKSALTLPPASRKAALRRIAAQNFSLANTSQAFAAAHLVGRLPAWSPPGYTLLHCAVLSPTDQPKAVLLRYGDGLKTLTVTEESDTGRQPAQADINLALARYGQQAWVRDEGGLCTIVRGDLSLPPALGGEMLSALSARTARLLSQGLSRDFGPGTAQRAARLRHQGWGYEQISALSLWANSHPQDSARLHALLAQGLSWSKAAASLELDQWEAQARSWVTTTISAGR
jgi:hypothetical protein